MTDKNIQDFDTVEEAIEYLRENDENIDELRVRLSYHEGPDAKEFDEEEIERHNPDLPVKEDDRTHQALWLLSRYGDEGFLSNFAIGELSEDPTFDGKVASPATNALLQAGYIHRGEEGKWVYHETTKKGERELQKLGDGEVEPSPFYDGRGGDALDGEWSDDE